MLIDLYSQTYLFRDPAHYLNNPCDKIAAGYIREYYRKRSKGPIFSFDLMKNGNLYSKASHTVSAFLLGMCFKSLVEATVVDWLRDHAPRSFHKFEYPWFLCCLYHDTFSRFERHNKNIELPDLDSVKEAAEIKYDIYDSTLDALKGTKWQTTYSKETIEKYYCERYNNSGNNRDKHTIDHGIFSGYFCFDRLIKNFLNKQEKEEQKKGGVVDYWEDLNGLVWDKDQIKIFALAADAIIAHNIWHDKDSDIPEICVENPHERKLSIEETPLAYYLSLIDTIEPVKYFTSSYYCGDKVYTEIDILKNIQMRYTDNLIIISQEDEMFDFKTWFKKKNMDTLSDWLKETDADITQKGKMIVIELPISEKNHP